jgi:nucleoid-associated protein YgaU
MAPEKATITNLQEPLGETNPIHVLFNPEEYTLNKDINYAQGTIPGLSGPILQFVNGNMSTLEMELLVDTLEAHPGSMPPHRAGVDVRILTKRITDLMEVNPNTHVPPVLQFVWGSLSFTCVLARCSQKFILFKPNGEPVRARLTVTFNEYLDPETEAKRVGRGTADYTKQHMVLQGEKITDLAARFYQNPQLWRPIALANRLDDPRSLSVGQRLIIPSLPFTDPQSGERFLA